MNTRTRYALIAAVALLATAAGVLVADYNQPKPIDMLGTTTNVSADKAQAIAQLLALTLPEVNAADQALHQWQGKLLVINFWASWCAPCREEMPGFSRLQQKYAAKGVQFVGIAIDSADKVKEFSLLIPVSYPLLIASPAVMQILSGLGNVAGGLPFTVIIGRDGSLRQSRLGIWQEHALETSILTDLAE